VWLEQRSQFFKQQAGFFAVTNKSFSGASAAKTVRENSAGVLATVVSPVIRPFDCLTQRHHTLMPNFLETATLASCLSL
jgi:hypothetical protein